MVKLMVAEEHGGLGLDASACPRNACGGLDRLLMPAQGLPAEDFIVCYYLPKDCTEDLIVCYYLPKDCAEESACFCLHKDCMEDLATCFGLCMNYVEDLDAYFCLSISYMKDMVADMNTIWWCWSPHTQEHGGGALLQQEGGAGPPLQGHGGRALLQQNGGACPLLRGCGRRSSTTTR